MAVHSLVYASSEVVWKCGDSFAALLSLSAISVRVAVLFASKKTRINGRRSTAALQDSSGRSLLAEDEIDHPAAAHMRAGPAAMVEDVRVCATGVFEGVAEDGHSVEGAFLVHRLRELRDDPLVPEEPVRPQDHLPKRERAEDAT